MHLIFLMARIYPFWAIPCSYLMFELGTFFRRRESPYRFLFWGGLVLFSSTVLLWGIYRGDLNSDIWVKALLG